MNLLVNRELLVRVLFFFKRNCFRWCVVITIPGYFSPVCTTELIRLSQLAPEFEKRNAKLIVLTGDSFQEIKQWCYDIKKSPETGAQEVWFPIIADESRDISATLQILDSCETDTDGLPLATRALFIIDPNKKLRLSLMYPSTTGRNFE